MRRPARVPLDALAPYLLAVPHPLENTLPTPIVWSVLFGNDQPIEIEVGSGKGLFLLNAALTHPERNFLGIEIDRKYALYAATRLAKRQLPNAKMAPTDARALLRDQVPDASVAAVHVYFPDPWWKTRHHKRRVFTEEFARQCARILQPGGLLHLATDVPEYFQVMTELIAAIPEFQSMPPPSERAPSHDMDYLSNFERKARKRDTPVLRASYALRS